MSTGLLYEVCPTALGGHAGVLYAGKVEHQPGFPQASEALSALRAQRKRNAERDRRQRIATVVNQIREEREAAGEREHDRLYCGRCCKGRERDGDRAHTVARALDAVVDQAVGVTVRMGVVMGMAMSAWVWVWVCLRDVIVFGTTAVIVLVRPDVRVGMAQCAVTVQLAVEQLVSGRGHAGSRLGRTGKCALC